MEEVHQDSSENWPLSQCEWWEGLGEGGDQQPNGHSHSAPASVETKELSRTTISSSNQTCMVEPQGNHSTVKGILKPIWSIPKGTWKILRPWEPNYLVWWLKDWTLWPECKESCLGKRGTAHRLASTMLWICLSAAGTGRLVRIEGEVNATMKMTYIPQLNFI